MSAIGDLAMLLASTGQSADFIKSVIDLAQQHAAETVADSPRISTGRPVDVAAEKRRAYDRERAKKRREKSGGLPKNALSSLPSSSETLEATKKEQIEECARGKKGERLPPDWQPKPRHFEEAIRLGLKVDEMLTDMRLWAEANGHRAVARKSNWDSTFSGWMRRESAKGNANGSDREKYSVTRAIARNLENGITFGPRPSLVRKTSGDPQLVLQQGGGTKP